MNKEAFLWGRRAAHDLGAVERFIQERAPAKIVSMTPMIHRSVDQIVSHRAEQLVAHTGQPLADRYRALVGRVRKAELALGAGDALTRAVAHNYHRLLAVKDEWEVARLYRHPDFKAALHAEFEGNYTLRYHIGAWPFARRNKTTGRVDKGELGPWAMSAFAVLARLKALRGTLLDPFRHAPERQLERSLIAQHEADVDRLLEKLHLDGIGVAVEIASLPSLVRGYGHVRNRQANEASERRERLFEDWSAIQQSLNAKVA